MALTPGQSAPDGAYVLGSLSDSQNQTESSIKAILKGAPIEAFSNAQGVHEINVRNPINSAQSTATTVESALPNVKAGQPLWSGIDPTAEVTVPRHDIPNGFTINQANARGAFIRLQGGDEKRIISWDGAGNASITDAYLDIYAMDPATGNLTLFHQSPDIAATLLASKGTHQYSMDPSVDGYLATKGDILYIELRVIGGGSHTIYGKTTSGSSALSGTYPVKFGGVRNGGAGTTSPSSITTANYSTTDDVPFFEVATDHGQDEIPRSWSDNFERADGSLGPNWVCRSTNSQNVTIVNQAVRYNGSTDGAQAALYLYPVTTDKVYSELNYASLGGGVGEACLFICSDNLMTNMCAIRVDNSSIEIATGSYSSMTDRASLSVTNNPGDNFSIEYDPASNVFAVHKNGSASPVLSWTDTGNVVSHGLGNRFVGMILNRVPFNSCGDVGRWLAKDIV